MRAVTVLVVLASLMPAPVSAQYFGRNKVQYERFDFKILETPHFDLHFYPAEADAAAQAARMAERWHARLTKLLRHELSGRQPLILYASHPHFEQTNVVEGVLGEGTGGVTEGGMRRVIMPFAASLAETDHVLGHELVHAFQYDILGENAGPLPLWFIEGMAEYLSLGPMSTQTSMWLRDAALDDKLPAVKDLDDPRYFPYRFGHAFWAYVAGRWGDEVVGRTLMSLSPLAEEQPGRLDAVSAIEAATGRDHETLTTEWHQAIREAYDIAPGKRERAARPGQQIIGERTGSGSVNVGPSLSPDGTRLAFLSERDRLSVELYVADAKTGRVIRKLTETAADPHFESLQFLASAGAWDPEGRRLALATVRAGKPVLAIIDTGNGRVEREVKFDDLGEIFQPTWSPDGRTIAFSAQVGGVTDLFSHDLQTAETRRLTHDAFADLQPAWSPDGRALAFVTDRFSTNLGELAFGHYGLALLTVGSGAIVAVKTSLTGHTINPQWGPGGASLFFISDADGRPNAYRLEIGTGRVARITSEATGVAGITPLSPALSVSPSGVAAVSVFREGGYEIHTIAIEATPVPEDMQPRAPRMLPPVARAAGPVTQLLARPDLGLPAAQAFPVRDYKPRLSLVGIGQQIGVASSGSMGTYVGGGLSMLFSDPLGDHTLGGVFEVNGGVRDVGAQAMYVNRARRVNWGVFAERQPLVSGAVETSLARVGGEDAIVEQVEIFRQTPQGGGVLVAYPFSRSSRFELTGAARQIGFSREIQTRAFSLATGELIADERIDLPSEPGIRMFDASAALVRDTSAFGLTGPLLGQRMRFEVTPTFGDLRMTNVLADLRQYLMPVRPITLAGRLLHVGRYGLSSSDQRLYPLFLGNSALVRGYDVNTFDVDDCVPSLGSTCPAFDRLIGTRVLVANAEIRAPLVGLFTGRISYGALPIDVFGFFDAGVAWTATEQPTFGGGTREWVRSAGAGARINLFGYAIVELNAVRPLSRPGRGWLFVFNMRQGF